MRLKNWLVSILIATVAVLVLAACGGDQPSSTNQTNDDAKNNETENDDNQNNEQENSYEETYDLGGRTIKLNFHVDLTPEEGTETGDLLVERWKAVEEKYNVKVEWTEIPYEEKIDHFVTTVLAGEPFADLVRMDPIQAAGLAKDDLLIPLDDIIDLSESKMSEQSKEAGRVNPDGKVYMMDTIASFANGGGIFYNKTMFDQAGLEDPYELVQRGEWNWDTFLHAAKTLTTGDQFGLALEPFGAATNLIIANDAKIVDHETGEIMLDDPHTMEALEFVADLWNVHKVVKPNDRSSDWEDPPVFFNEGLVAMTSGEIWEAEQRADAPFDWGYVYWPIGPNATEYAAIKQSGGGYVIPKGVENPEILYKIWEDLQIWEYQREHEIARFESLLPNQESVNIATEMLDNVKVDFWRAYDLADAFYGTFGAITSGEETPAQAVAKIKPEAQARVDAFLGK